MNTTPNDAIKKGHNLRSSISVSNKEVCRDEACIGKDVQPAVDTPAVPSQPETRDRKSSGTSISVGGKEACSEDACIGKK